MSISSLAKAECDPIDIYQKLSEQFSVIPIHAGAKNPVELDWSRWCREKRPFIRKDFAGRNAGIACGPASGLLVLDVDNIALFRSACRRYRWRVPETFTVKTGSGKFHYYYRYPLDGRDYSGKVLQVLGFDIRGVGSCAVAPGSTHPDTGNVYEIGVDTSISEPPAWIFDLYGHHPEWTKPDVEKIKISEKARNLIMSTEALPIENLSEIVDELIAIGQSDDQVFFIFYEKIASRLPKEEGINDTNIQRMIDAARTIAPSRPTLVYSSVSPASAFSFDGDLDRVPVGGHIKKLISDGVPKGERSEAIMKVVDSLVHAGLAEEGIFSIFDRYPIGEKYREVGTTKESWLRRHIEKARLYVAASVPEFDVHLDRRPIRSCFEDLDLDKLRVGRFLRDRPDPIHYLLEHSLPLGSLGLVVSNGGIGKSYLLLQLGISVASFVPFLNGLYKVENAGKAFLLFAEDQEEVIHYRMQAITSELVHPGSLKFLQSMLDRNLFIKSAAGEDPCLYDHKRGGPTLGYYQLLKILDKIPGLKLVVLDPISRFFSGDENDNSCMTRFAMLLESIAARTGATVIASHHTSKAAASSKTGKAALVQEAIRGSSGLTNAARWQLNISNIGDKECKELGIDKGESKKYLVAGVTKKNVGPPEDPFYLKRIENGVIRRVIVEDEIADPIYEQVILKVGELEEVGKPTTERGFLRLFKDEWPGYGMAKLRRLIEKAFLEERLFIVERKNPKGRKTMYLSAKPPSIEK